MWNRLSEIASNVAAGLQDESDNTLNDDLLQDKNLNSLSDLEFQLLEKDKMMNNLKDLIVNYEKDLTNKDLELKKVSADLSRFKLQAKAKITNLEQQLSESKNQLIVNQTESVSYSDKDKQEHDDASSIASSDSDHFSINQKTKAQNKVLKKRLKDMELSLTTRDQQISRLLSEAEAMLRVREERESEFTKISEELDNLRMERNNAIRTGMEQPSIEEIQKKMLEKDEKILQLDAMLITKDTKLFELVETIDEKETIIMGRNRAIQLLNDSLMAKENQISENILQISNLKENIEFLLADNGTNKIESKQKLDELSRIILLPTVTCQSIDHIESYVKNNISQYAFNTLDSEESLKNSKILSEDRDFKFLNSNNCYKFEVSTKSQLCFNDTFKSTTTPKTDHYDEILKDSDMNQLNQRVINTGDSNDIVENLHHKISLLTGDLIEKDTMIDTLSIKVNELETNVLINNQFIEDSKNKLISNEDDILQLKLVIENYEKDLKDKDDKILTLNLKDGEINILRDKVLKLEETLSRNKENILILEDQIVELNILKMKLSDSELNIKHRDDRINALEVSLQDIPNLTQLIQEYQKILLPEKDNLTSSFTSEITNLQLTDKEKLIIDNTISYSELLKNLGDKNIEVEKLNDELSNKDILISNKTLELKDLQSEYENKCENIENLIDQLKEKDKILNEMLSDTKNGKSQSSIKMLLGQEKVITDKVPENNDLLDKYNKSIYQIDSLISQLAENELLFNNKVFEYNELQCKYEKDCSYIHNYINQLHKKEKSTDCDSALMPLLCVHG